ncbi:hypothetical protein [Glutamicibacter sp. NPDC087344]|uniref:hypothetical protein n=1 Tax=Glutamicibacter sp. NPDC087344 TaxID=3363994 RepID=UPI00380522AE
MADLEEVADLRRQNFILMHQLKEFRQALADSQFALSQANAELALATQPTE